MNDAVINARRNIRLFNSDAKSTMNASFKLICDMLHDMDAEARERYETRADGILARLEATADLSDAAHKNLDTIFGCYKEQDELLAKLEERGYGWVLELEDREKL